MAPIPGVYVRRRFLPSGLLIPLREHTETAVGNPAAVQRTPGAALAVDDEVRRAWEVELPDDLHDRLTGGIERLRAELATFFSVALDPCETVAAVRYPPGSFYRTHRDRAERRDAYGLHRRAVSIVVFVNTGSPHPTADFGGGSLRLHEVAAVPRGILDITPVAGMLVAFRSSQMHEVTPVEWGTRVTIVGWLLKADEADRVTDAGGRPPIAGKRR
ncbi:MAG TPA: 2OG-Fe(II) oxygenase [Vicinamibacterales bacterium]|nr:2OG-Fe(II) oxygenase [Vicinamibacterales bacterium]